MSVAQRPSTGFHASLPPLPTSPQPQQPPHHHQPLPPLSARPATSAPSYAHKPKYHAQPFSNTTNSHSLVSPTHHHAPYLMTARSYSHPTSSSTAPSSVHPSPTLSSTTAPSPSPSPSLSSSAALSPRASPRGPHVQLVHPVATQLPYPVFPPQRLNEQKDREQSGNYNNNNNNSHNKKARSRKGKRVKYVVKQMHDVGYQNEKRRLTRLLSIYKANSQHRSQDVQLEMRGSIRFDVSNPELIFRILQEQASAPLEGKEEENNHANHNHAHNHGEMSQFMIMHKHDALMPANYLKKKSTKKRHERSEQELLDMDDAVLTDLEKWKKSQILLRLQKQREKDEFENEKRLRASEALKQRLERERFEREEEEKARAEEEERLRYEEEERAARTHAKHEAFREQIRQQADETRAKKMMEELAKMEQEEEEKKADIIRRKKVFAQGYVPTYMSSTLASSGDKDELDLEKKELEKLWKISQAKLKSEMQRVEDISRKRDARLNVNDRVRARQEHDDASGEFSLRDSKQFSDRIQQMRDKSIINQEEGRLRELMAAEMEARKRYEEYMDRRAREREKEENKLLAPPRAIINDAPRRKMSASNSGSTLDEDEDHDRKAQATSTRERKMSKSSHLTVDEDHHMAPSRSRSRLSAPERDKEREKANNNANVDGYWAGDENKSMNNSGQVSRGIPSGEKTPSDTVKSLEEIAAYQKQMADRLKALTSFDPSADKKSSSTKKKRGTTANTLAPGLPVPGGSISGSSTPMRGSRGKSISAAASKDGANSARKSGGDPSQSPKLSSTSPAASPDMTSSTPPPSFSPEQGSLSPAASPDFSPLSPAQSPPAFESNNNNPQSTPPRNTRTSIFSNEISSIETNSAGSTYSSNPRTSIFSNEVSNIESSPKPLPRASIFSAEIQQIESAKPAPKNARTSIFSNEIASF